MLALVSLFAFACTSEADELVDEVTDLIAGVNDVVVMAAAFAPYDEVTTDYDETYFYVGSNGLPAHEMMVGITAWIAQVPVPHDYMGDNAWSIPIHTKYSEAPVSIEGNLQRGAIGVASNGIPIFNPVNSG